MSIKISVMHSGVQLELGMHFGDFDPKVERKSMLYMGQLRIERGEKEEEGEKTRSLCVSRKKVMHAQVKDNC